MIANFRQHKDNTGDGTGDGKSVLN